MAIGVPGYQTPNTVVSGLKIQAPYSVKVAIPAFPTPQQTTNYTLSIDYCNQNNYSDSTCSQPEPALGLVYTITPDGSSTLSLALNQFYTSTPLQIQVAKKGLSSHNVEVQIQDNGVVTINVDGQQLLTTNLYKSPDPLYDIKLGVDQQVSGQFANAWIIDIAQYPNLNGIILPLLGIGVAVAVIAGLIGVLSKQMSKVRAPTA